MGLANVPVDLWGLLLHAPTSESAVATAREGMDTLLMADLVSP